MMNSTFYTLGNLKWNKKTVQNKHLVENNYQNFTNVISKNYD